jgi:hypothetical protein
VSVERCERFEKALSRGEEAIAALEPHALRCEECRESLRLWKEIEEAGPSLQKRWESPGLLPGVIRGIEAEKGKPQAAPAPRRRLSWIPIAAAASLFVLSMVGLYVFKPGESVRDPLTRPSFGKEALLGEDTLKEVGTAESNYLASIAKLSSLAEGRMANPETPVLASYREKLQLLDSAIADLRSQLESNRFNTHLRKELLAMYQEKKRTLEEVVKEEIVKEVKS